jgi:hypothetical protein
MVCDVKAPQNCISICRKHEVAMVRDVLHTSVVEVEAKFIDT